MYVEWKNTYVVKSGNLTRYYSEEDFGKFLFLLIKRKMEEAEKNEATKKANKKSERTSG